MNIRVLPNKYSIHEKLIASAGGYGTVGYSFTIPSSAILGFHELSHCGLISVTVQTTMFLLGFY